MLTLLSKAFSWSRHNCLYLDGLRAWLWFDVLLIIGITSHSGELIWEAVPWWPQCQRQCLYVVPNYWSCKNHISFLLGTASQVVITLDTFYSPTNQPTKKMLMLLTTAVCLAYFGLISKLLLGFYFLQNLSIYLSEKNRAALVVQSFKHEFWSPKGSQLGSRAISFSSIMCTLIPLCLFFYGSDIKTQQKLKLILFPSSWFFRAWIADYFISSYSLSCKPSISVM